VYRRYIAQGPQAETEPGSRGRVLRNLLGVHSVRQINELESVALDLTQREALLRLTKNRRITANDICMLHRLWLGQIYPWAGNYRSVNMGKGGFQFANAALIAGLMDALELGVLAQYTPCIASAQVPAALALAAVHAELILIHPFRDGNGRIARLVASIMAEQAGLPPLDFSPLLGKGKQRYIGAIHTAMGRDYTQLAQLFEKVIAAGLRLQAANA
jgi:cell filamentation protein